MPRLRLIPTFSCWLWTCAALAAAMRALAAADFSPANPTATFAIPDVLTATICSTEPAPVRPLFRFKRTFTRTASNVHVLREYTYPDGKLAARERVVYENNALTLYELDEVQTGGAGSAVIQRDPAHPEKGKITFQFTKDSARHPPSGTRTEPLQPDTLVNDNIGPFLAAHWDRLSRGEKVGCRYLVIPRRETVGFTFKKESETQWHGCDVLVLKMEPSSLVIAAMVDPLHFVIEKTPPHRVLQYTGRTTPKLGSPGHWTDLDAVTIFDW